MPVREPPPRPPPYSASVATDDASVFCRTRLRRSRLDAAESANGDTGNDETPNSPSEDNWNMEQKMTKSRKSGLEADIHSTTVLAGLLTVAVVASRTTRTAESSRHA